jgi:hypothetical protein
MKNIYGIVIFLLSCITNSYSEIYKGKIIDRTTSLPIEYVNIGIVGKNIGTVSDVNGNFSLTIDIQHNNDTLLISCLGYFPKSIKVEDFIKSIKTDIKLDEKVTELPKVIVLPKKYKNKRLGISTQSKSIQAGFKENQLGYECGVMMKIKKSAILENVNINIAFCTYDSIFYRLNIYKVLNDKTFENILQKPIYIKMSKNEIKNEIKVDLSQSPIIVNGNTLITLEHIKNLGSGQLNFCAGFSGKTYYRKTSQGNWESAPIGVSISVDAKVEK